MMKLTLDTNCFNRKPHRSLDKIFELEKQGEIKIFYADSLIDDVQEGNEKILSLPGNKQKAASERLRKAQQYKQIKSGITFRHPYNIFPIIFLQVLYLHGCLPLQEFSSSFEIGFFLLLSNYFADLFLISSYFSLYTLINKYYEELCSKRFKSTYLMGYIQQNGYVRYNERQL